MKKTAFVFSRPVMVLAVFLLTCAVYCFVLVQAPNLDLPLERTVDAAGLSGIRVYIEPTAVDPIRDAMQVRVSIEPKISRATLQPTLPEQDFDLALMHDNETERVQVHAHQPFPTVSVELDLYDGDVTRYPLDRYHAVLGIAAVPSAQGAAPEVLPVSATIWQRVLGFRLRAVVTAGATGQVQINFEISRSRTSLYFALAIYGAMVVLGCSAILLGTLTFLRIRRIDVSAISALAAMVFALPALRNALPGSPPLGVLGDVLVFVWAEVAAVLSLALVVESWARSGPRPDR